MKCGKKIKLDIDRTYKTYYGTVDNKNFKSTYVTLSCWSQPNQEEENWDKIINRLRRKIRLELYKSLDTTLFKHDKSIIDLDLRASGIRLNKRSFLSCEITLFVKPQLEFKSPILKESVTNIFNDLIGGVFSPYPYFEFHPTKA
jgi:hypothetical protein